MLRVLGSISILFVPPFATILLLILFSPLDQIMRSCNEAAADGNILMFYSDGFDGIGNRLSDDKNTAFCGLFVVNTERSSVCAAGTKREWYIIPLPQNIVFV